MGASPISSPSWVSWWTCNDLQHICSGQRRRTIHHAPVCGKSAGCLEGPEKEAKASWWQRCWYLAALLALRQWIAGPWKGSCSLSLLVGLLSLERIGCCLHPDCEAGSNSRGWPGSASALLGFVPSTQVSLLVAWWYVRARFRSVVALYLVTSSFALLYLKRVTSVLVGHGSFLEAGVLE